MLGHVEFLNFQLIKFITTSFFKQSFKTNAKQVLWEQNESFMPYLDSTNTTQSY